MKLYRYCSRGPNLVTDGLVLHLDAGHTKSYSGSGTLWRDLSTYNNNCTLVNGPIFNGANKGAIQFDATNDYGEIAHSSSLNFTTGLTVSLWFNRGDILALLPVSDGHQLFHKGNSISTGDPANPSISLFGPTGGGRYAWRSAAVNNRMDPPNQIFFANQWYNIVFSHNSGSTPIPFLNGIKQTDWTVTLGSASNPLVTNNFRLTISGDVERPSTTRHAAFNGRIAIVQAYNRALTDNEIVQNFNALKGRFGL